jgi:hypothetical protein
MIRYVGDEESVVGCEVGKEPRVVLSGGAEELHASGSPRSFALNGKDSRDASPGESLPASTRLSERKLNRVSLPSPIRGAGLDRDSTLQPSPRPAVVHPHGRLYLLLGLFLATVFCSSYHTQFIRRPSLTQLLEPSIYFIPLSTAPDHPRSTLIHLLI